MTPSLPGSSKVGPLAGSRLSPPRAVHVLAMLLLVLPRPVASAIINVGGGCTLVDAITAANTDAPVGGCPAGDPDPTADEIRLTADVTLTQVDNTIAGGTGTFAGPNGLPQVDTVIVIEGNGHTIARGAGAPVFRIFSVAFPGNLTLQNLTLTNGGGTTFNYLGGAIANIFNATITVTDSTVSGNSAGGFFGGGGGIYNGGNAFFVRTTISGNSAYNGGGMSNPGIATLTNSTLSGNSGGTDKGGAIDNPGTVTLVNSTFSGNTAGATGAGAIDVFSGEARLTNTLLSGNSPVNCTTGSGSVVNNGNNLADDTSCGTILGTLTGVEAALLDNGGPTKTHALLAASNARDAGWAPNCPVTDQRGAARVSTCDIGAFEFVPCPDLELHLAESGEKTYENCQRIVTVPNFAVTGTGNVTLRAGSAVILGNGTEVDTNGQLEIELDPDLQLIPPPP